MDLDHLLALSRGVWDEARTPRLKRCVMVIQMRNYLEFTHAMGLWNQSLGTREPGDADELVIDRY